MRRKFRPETRNSSSLSLRAEGQKPETEPGQSLLEVVVAMAITAILAISVVSTILITQKSSKSAANNTQATKLVQDSIEKMRIFRDRKGFNNLSAGNCLWLNSSLPDPTAWSLTPNNTCSLQLISLGNKDFSRQITINDIRDPSSGQITQKQVIITVTWEESGGMQKVKNETFLSSSTN